MIQDIFSTAAAIVILYESYQPNLIPDPVACMFGMSYFGYDILYHKIPPDFIFHHIITGGFLIVSLTCPYSIATRIIICGAEWSTLVLNIIPYLPNSLQNRARLLFVLLFFKFRLLDWYFMFQEHTFLYVQIIPALALYSLNLYWFVIICKKMAKPLKSLSLHVLNHHIVSYTMMINSVLIYMMYPTMTFIKYMSILLGISSYLYHKEIACYYDGIPSIQSRWIIWDIIVFHVFQGGYMHFIQYSLSIYIHAVNVFYIYWAMPHDISSASLFSFGIDIVYLLYDNPNIELFTISLLFVYIHLINPFYDISYVSTHLLLCWYIHNRTNYLLNL